MRTQRNGGWARPALSFVGVMTLTACLGLCLARLSGDSPRSFPVLPPDDSVSIGSSSHTVDEIARRYRPRIVELPQARPDPVVGVSYEAWTDGDDLLITYFFTWSDEVHPYPVAHALYGLYRWAYYLGRQDVEYIQVRVSGDGDVLGVRFESAADLDPWTSRPVHVDASAEPVGPTWRRYLTDDDGDRPVLVDVPAPVGERMVLYVATWNHLLDVLPPPLDVGGWEEAPDSPLPVHRSASDYEAQAGARRGHPSPESTETPGRALLGQAGGVMYVSSPLVALATVLVRRRMTS